MTRPTSTNASAVLTSSAALPRSRASAPPAAENTKAANAQAPINPATAAKPPALHPAPGTEKQPTLHVNLATPRHPHPPAAQAHLHPQALLAAEYAQLVIPFTAATPADTVRTPMKVLLHHVKATKATLNMEKETAEEKLKETVMKLYQAAA